MPLTNYFAVARAALGIGMRQNIVTAELVVRSCRAHTIQKRICNLMPCHVTVVADKIVGIEIIDFTVCELILASNILKTTKYGFWSMPRSIAPHSAIRIIFVPNCRSLVA
jgi:hypothetical protein